jgi:membrane associated rhomboid family serine protease
MIGVIHSSLRMGAAVVTISGVMVVGFHGMRKDQVNRRWPVIAWAVTALTLATNGLQIVYPPLVELWRRDPAALRHGELWRMITPLFVQSGGWPQILSNTLWAFLLTPLAARRFGPLTFLALYFGGGLVGEIAGYAWAPYDAGSSVAISGLAGGLAVHVLNGEADAPRLIRIWAMAALLGSLLLTACRDLHGPSILFGAAIGLVTLRKAATAGGRGTDEER